MPLKVQLLASTAERVRTLLITLKEETEFWYLKRRRGSSSAWRCYGMRRWTTVRCSRSAVADAVEVGGRGPVVMDEEGDEEPGEVRIDP